MNLEKLTMSQVIRNDFRTVQIFEGFGLKCYGNLDIPIYKTCKKNDIDMNKLTDELNKLSTNHEYLYPINRFDDWSLDFLVKYIIINHHNYVRQNSHRIFQLINRTANQYGKKYPETSEITNLFENFHHVFEQHIFREEKVLFPYISKIAKTAKKEKMLNGSEIKNLKNSLKKLIIEHENAKEQIDLIMKLTDNYTPPVDASDTHKLAYHELKIFGMDLCQHCFIENYILFPKAIELEKELSLKLA